MKILFVNVPYAGHTNPTLPLTKELVRRGHTVAYINAPEWRKKIEDTGAVFIPYLDYAEGLSEQQKKMQCFPAAYRTAMKVGKAYDILVYEMFFYLGKTIADRLEIPCIRQFSQPVWTKEMINVNIKNPSSWFRSMILLLSIKLIEIQVVHKKAAKEMNVVGKKMIESVLNDVPPLNVVYLPRKFQPLGDSFDQRFIFSCPAMQDMSTSDSFIPYEILKRPIIYISMGSIMSSKIFCRRCIKAFGNKELTVILNIGKVKKEDLGTIPDNILAFSFVPQLVVLQHADLFITHGGMNSVNEAMYYGVPMLVMPVINDQPRNATQVVDLGIGQSMKAFPTTYAKLYKNAINVLNNQEIKNNSAKMKEEIRNDKGVTELAIMIEEFLLY